MSIDEGQQLRERFADAALNAAYAQVQKAKPRGTVTFEGVRKTQRVWVRYPPVTAESWKTWLTRARIEMLARLPM